MFLSRYNLEFQKLDSVQQQHIVELSGVVVALADNNRGDDDDNNDSTVPPLYCYDVMRAIAFQWRTMTKNIKRSWERRAVFFKTRPILGLLNTILHNNLPGNLETTVIITLQHNWVILCNSFNLFFY